MKKYPIHENLNTSFVNLEALVSHLRALQFVGSIHIELSSYDADITFTRSNSIQARDHDHIAGRITEGMQALRRILMRAKEPCGRIHVYHAPVMQADTFGERIFVDDSIASGARAMISNRCDTPANYFPTGGPGFKASFGIQNRSKHLPLIDEQSDLPDLPFALLDVTGEKTAELQISPEEWEVFLNLMAELLQTIDESLTKADLHFFDVFQNACAFVADEHSFLDPDSDKVAYKNGELTARQQVSPKVFSAGTVQALRRIFDRLHENPKFGTAAQSTMLSIRVLMQRRKPLYDRYSLTPQLQKITGV